MFACIEFKPEVFRHDQQMFKETVAAFRKCSITLFCQQYPELSRPQIKGEQTSSCALDLPSLEWTSPDLMERLVSIGVVQKHGDRYKVPEDQNGTETAGKCIWLATQAFFHRFRT